MTHRGEDICIYAHTELCFVLFRILHINFINGLRYHDFEIAVRQKVPPSGPTFWSGLEASYH